MKKILSTFLMSIVFMACSANILPDPGFEEIPSGWPQRTKGMTEFSEKETYSGKKSIRLFTDAQSNKVTQLFSRNILLNADKSQPCRFKFSFCHKGDNGTVYLRFYRKSDNKLTEVKSLTDKPVVARFSAKGSAEWNKAEYEFILSEEYFTEPIYVKVHFQLWGAAGKQMELYLDDVNLELLAAGQPEKTVPTKPTRLVMPPDHNNNATPMPKLSYEFGQKDGYLTKNGKPFYFTGNYGTGGGQWALNTLWLARLFCNAMVTLDWSKNFLFKVDKKTEELVFSWQNSESAISAIREFTRNDIIIEFDGGNYSYKKGFPQNLMDNYEFIRKIHAPGNHFYAFDHNTPEGRQLIYGDWASRFRFMKFFPLMTFEVWNELGYLPRHERIQIEFREFAEKKYGSLQETNRVWRRNFTSWDEVLPPHITKYPMNPAMTHSYRQDMRNKFPEMYYDYLRFVQLDFIPGFKEMKKHFRTFSNAPYSVDWRGHTSYSDGYATLDIDLLDEVIDINMLHTWINMYEYRNQPAEPEPVLRSITNGLLFHNFLRTNSDKPIINPEDIISHVESPGSDEKLMAENCLAQFPNYWKFILEEDNGGIAKEYFKTDFDDSAWGKMSVPGCWDETKEYKGQKGFGWYRTNFKIPGNFKQDQLDGSRRFYLYGRGVAQSGIVWVNGIEVGRPKGWNSRYQLDIGPYLNFGGDNQITFMVHGSNYSNGLRFYVHILPHDMINERRLFEKKDYTSRLWTYMMQGASAVTLWNWDDKWRPFMPEITTEINSVAEIAMPSARHNYEKQVGVLMPFLFFRGLPVGDYFLDYMNYFGALAFRQLPTAAMSEKNILKATPEKYPVIFYPYARIVWNDTFEHMKKYVESGGIAVITHDSLSKTFERYEPTTVNQFAGIKVTGDYDGQKEIIINNRKFSLLNGDMTGKFGVTIQPDGAAVTVKYANGTPAITEVKRGKGKVIFVAANLDFHGAHEITSIASGIQPMIKLKDTGDPSEFPYLEGRISGDAKRFMAYLHNWGGKSREVAFAVGKEFLTAKSYRIRNIRDHSAPEVVVESAKLANDGWRITVRPCEPAALLFEDASLEPLKLHTPSPERMQVIRKIEELDQDSPGNGKRVLLFKKIGHEYLGRKGYPQLAAFLNEAGIGSREINLVDLTPELLKEFDMVFLAESHIAGIRPLEKSTHPFYDMMIDYVRNGGSIFIAGTSAQGSHSNGRQQLNNVFGRKLGWGRGPYARNPESCGYGDAMQIKAADFADHPVTRHIKSIQFFTLPTYKLSAKCELLPLVKTADNDQNAPSAPVIIGGQLGKGKAVFAHDTLWMQPLRIEAADNAQLLMNIINYLTGQEIRKYDRAELRQKLLITDDAIRKMEAEEWQ